MIARNVGNYIPVDRWQYTRRLSVHSVSRVILIFRIVPRRLFVRKVKSRCMTLTSCRRCHNGVKRRRRRRHRNGHVPRQWFHCSVGEELDLGKI
jgi:hypothetical protein